MSQLDLTDLPKETVDFVGRLTALGIDDRSIHGIFVTVGFIAGAPKFKDEIEALWQPLMRVMPFDRTQFIDEVVGDIYEGYDGALNEFCFRSGLEFEFREIGLPDHDFKTTICKLKDEGLLDTRVTEVKQLVDSVRLYTSFFSEVGEGTYSKNAPLLKAFLCGVFQMQLHGKFDVKGTMQIAEALKWYLPPVFGRIVNALLQGNLEYFIGLEDAQIPLHHYTQAMKEPFGRQFWGYQSSVFFSEGEKVNGLEELNLYEWFEWVSLKAFFFDNEYRDRIVPLSQSGLTLDNLPAWNDGDLNYEECVEFIHETWGLQPDGIATRVDNLEYRALLIHVTYASMAKSHEVLH
jgi:hypothetical protein